MNILTFDYEYPPLGGGGGVVHALIAEELAKHHRVWVVTSAFEGLPRREERAGVNILRVPVLGRNDRAAASLLSMLTYPPGAWMVSARLLRRERIDVVHGHFAVPTGPGSLPPAKVAGVPHVISIHGGDIYDPSKALSPHRIAPMRAAVRWVLRGSAAVVAQSTNTRDNARRYYGFEGPIEVIPLGIRQPSVAPATRAELGLPKDAFLTITVGRLVRRKGLDVLLRSLARVDSETMRLLVVGDGPERPELERLAAELGLRDRVQFLGRVEEERKWQLLQAADAYVSATMHEGFGLVYLEALAAGIPVITFDHGGQVDFLRDGETGYLVPTGDLAALTAAITRLAADPARARSMGEANRRRAVNHRIEECAARYEELFTRLLEGSGASPVRNDGPRSPRHAASEI
jgi:glycosyltransferase involved in cell wall biosynthesis